MGGEGKEGRDVERREEEGERGERVFERLTRGPLSGVQGGEIISCLH